MTPEPVYDENKIDNTNSTVEGQLWERLQMKSDGPLNTGAESSGNLSIPAPGPPFYFGGILSWKLEPFPYQVEGIDLLLSRDALLLADDMGLGKTLQAIFALRILLHQKRIRTVLIIVPAGLISQWRRDLHFLAADVTLSTVYGPVEDRSYQWRSTAEVFLTSYETFRSDFTNNPQSAPRRRIWDLVILDEAQKIKNRKAIISWKCKRLPRRRAWALTGTPLENCPEDLASILEFTRPIGKDESPPRIYPGWDMEEMHKDMQLRRKKEDVLPDLPPKIVSTIPLQLLPLQRKIYDRAEKEGILQLKEMGKEVKINHVFELIIRLKQICNCCPVSGESSKMDDIEDKIKTLAEEGHRAIIFSQFIDGKHGVMAIYRRLRHFNPLVFTGKLSIIQKDDIIRLFKTEKQYKILILSLRAGGQGLNLQDASYVFHFDRWWNPAVEHQAEDRSHRLGQKYPVHVYQYTCENTIENRIEDILSEKQILFDELIDNVTIDIRSRLSESELFGLFGLTPPPSRKSR
jgi:SNF2 family DNA or RNA helicase